MAGVLKKIEIIEDNDASKAKSKVNDFLIALCNECINPDEIEMLCNITLFGNGRTYYTYTIIYEEE